VGTCSRNAAPVVVSALLLQACGAGWHRTDIVTPPSPRQQVEVWQGTSSRQWHAVRVTDSTVSGISFVEPVECDSCRQTVRRASVDSIRLGDPTLGFWKSFGLILLAPVTLFFGACALNGFHGCSWGPGT